MTRLETPAEEDRTVRLARRRFARRQWARRWLAWRKLLAGALVLGLLAVAAWMLLASSVLAVDGVVVRGTSLLTADEVRRAAQVPEGTPLARVDLEAIAARVETMPAVRSAEVTRDWPDRLRIRVRERVPVAVVRREGVLRGLDAEGVLFRRYRSRPGGLPVVHTGPETGADALAEAARVVRALPSSLATRVDYLEVRTVDTISLRLRDGRTVLWGSADDSAAKAEVLDVLLQRKASFYDVSVPGQPLLRR